MGEQDALDGDAGLVDGGEDAVHVAAGIDNQSEFGRVIPQDGAVLLEGGDRDHRAAKVCHGVFPAGIFPRCHALARRGAGCRSTGEGAAGLRSLTVRVPLPDIPDR